MLKVDQEANPVLARLETVSAAGGRVPDRGYVFGLRVTPSGRAPTSPPSAQRTSASQTVANWLPKPLNTSRALDSSTVASKVEVKNCQSPVRSAVRLKPRLA